MCVKTDFFLSLLWFRTLGTWAFGAETEKPKSYKIKNGRMEGWKNKRAFKRPFFHPVIGRKQADMTTSLKL